MFYIGIKGGLGNQMFQYAFGYAAKLKSGLSAALDTSAYERQSPKDTPRTFTLQHYNISLPIASQKETRKFHTPMRRLIRGLIYKIFPAKNHVFDAKEFNVRNGELKTGYWQCARYFEDYADDIRKEFTLRDGFGNEAMEAIGEIESLKSLGIVTVLVHVRRGDYVTNPYAAAVHGTATAEYFETGISLIQNRLILSDTAKKTVLTESATTRIHVCFATEDIAWTREHLTNRLPAGITSTFISRPGIRDYEELLIMSACDHFVISNSSFSWWSAWLGSNPNKIVVAPKRWKVNPKERTDDVTPPNWLRI